MSDLSGQPVLVTDVALPARPESDLDRLVGFITDRFDVRDRELITLQRSASRLKLKGDLVQLGFEAIDFRRELSGWIALARRVRDEHLADAMDSSHDERSQEAKADLLKRPNAKLVETRAKATIAPLNEAIERLDAARDEMVGIVSWCQSLQRAVRDEEFGSILESSTEAPEQMYRAPIGAALRKLEH